MGVKPLIGICDYCQNTNVQKLTPYGNEDLCNRCLEDRKKGATGSAKFKRQRDQHFIDDYRNIVGGVQS